MPVLWFTGLPCSGKTTIADALAEKLRAYGLSVERLDGDVVRKYLCRDLGFSREDREENINRVTFVSKLLSRNGVFVLASFVSPYRDRRLRSREEIGDFVEVFVKCPLDVCIERDVKGMYKRALAGEIKGFTGIDDPYEEPDNPEVVVDTSEESLDESVDFILSELKSRGYING